MQNIDLHAWCFLSGRICALENKLLKKDFFEHLLSQPSAIGFQPKAETRRSNGGIPSASGGEVAMPPQEILSCLKESPLREDFLTPEDVLSFEEILHRRFFRFLHEAKELSPEPWVLELFQARYDFINLKNFLKEKLLNLKRPSLAVLPPFPSPHTDETWEALWEGHDLVCRDSNLALSESGIDRPEGLSLCLPLIEMYRVAVKNLKGHLEKVSKTPGLLDIIMDGIYLSSIPQLVEKVASSFIMDYYLEYQKLVGILFLWRSEQVYRLNIKDLQRYIFGFTLPLNGRGTEGDWEKALRKLLPERVIVGAIHELPLLKYERAVEDTLMERLEGAKFFVFGPERVFGYLKGLETETLNLRLAIGGRLHGIPTEEVNRKLHKGYV